MKKVFSTILASIPVSVFAQTTNTTNSSISQVKTLNDVVSKIANIGDIVIYLLVALAVVYIIWNIVRYFIKGEKGDESRKVAGTNILWGIAGLAIIVSIWGLVNILLNTFKTDTNVPKDRFPSANFVTNKTTTTNTNAVTNENTGNYFH